MSFIAGVMAGLLIVLAAVWLRDRRDLQRRRRRGLSDEQIRAIESKGRIEVEDPLDMDHIRDEESRFWKETWDEPEEW